MTAVCDVLMINLKYTKICFTMQILKNMFHHATALDDSSTIKQAMTKRRRIK